MTLIPCPHAGVIPSPPDPPLFLPPDNSTSISGIQHVMCPESGHMVVLVTEDTALHIVSLNTWSVKFKLCNVLKRYLVVLPC